MNGKSPFLALSAVILCLLFTLCGCEKESFPEESGSAETSETSAVTTVPESSETAETETSLSENQSAENRLAETQPAEIQPAESQLAENQLEYSGENIYVLMEFTGAESLLYYPRALNLSMYRDDDYVLHSKITVTNISEKSFDFIPQKLSLNGRHKEDSGFMTPITARDTGLAASDGYRSVGAGETVSFDVDFVGDEVCLDYADKIRYSTVGFHYYNNVDADGLDNASAAEFDISDIKDRSRIKNAVRAAKAFQAENTAAPSELVPAEGEYSVLTDKNSYCFTAEPVADGDYIRVALRVQCLTGEPEVFEPVKFRLYRTGEYSTGAHDWSIDPLLTRMFYVDTEKSIKGVSEPVYSSPWDLYVRSDGTAEYTMYFFSANNEPSDFYKFCYEGENDAFECFINMS